MKGLPRSLARGNPNVSPAKRMDIAVNAAITVAGETGVGFGSIVAGDFPEGNILFLGAVANLTFTGPTSDDLSDTWNGDFAVGTTPADDGTVAGTDVNIIPSTAVGPAVAEVSPDTRGANATAAMFDNTDGSLEVNLSLLVDDAGNGADDIDVTALGTIHIAYVVLGDD